MKFATSQVFTNISYLTLQGHPRLVQALSKVYSPRIGREIEPMNEILVTTGAYEALYSTILGKLTPFHCSR